MIVLAGDIGGTSARLAIVEIDAGSARIVRNRRYPSREFPALAPIIQTFLAETGTASVPERACFGIAGPVINGTCRATNLAWIVDERTLAAQIGVPRTTIINDIHAVGHAIGRLGPTDLRTLQPGQPAARGVVALIAAGTGLGQAFLTWSPDGYQVHDSEGGHASFSPRTAIEWELTRFLSGRFGHVSWERVLSGRGLVDVYDHLAASGYAPERPEIRAEMKTRDPAAVVSSHALDGSDALCVGALDLFSSVYGAQAGNLALTVMARGGVYIAGGIAPRIAEKLVDGSFIEAFRDKGRLSDALARFPVNLITNPHVGMIGAAVVAWDGG